MADVTATDIKRLEDKLDRLADGMSRLILIDERQVLQSSRVEKLELRLSLAEDAGRKTEARVTSWVQRGVGVWAAVVVGWSVWQVVHPLLAAAAAR